MSITQDTEQADVVVVGLGYIGLPTAAILATHGQTVVGVDVNPDTVQAVNEGKVPFVEPDLETAVAGAVTQGRLSATGEMPPARVYIIAVPTPFAENHAADLAYIDAATDAIAPCLRGGELVILESTSPPGTTRHVANRLLAARDDLSGVGQDGEPLIQFAHCPERVLPGRVMVELVTNDRVVGGLTPGAAERAKALYEIFCQGEIPLTDATTAEMAKLVENSFRDVNIAFANELATIAEELGIDVWELIELANRHPRVNILEPGPGVGGHCIAVDPWFIVSSAPESARLVRTAREVNDAKPGKVVNQVIAAAAGREDLRIAALGLAFKPDIDDLRESPAVEIVEGLSSGLPKAEIVVVEPHVSALPPRLTACENVAYAALESVTHADIVLVLVNHTVFREAKAVRDLAQGSILIDTRGMLR